MDEQKPNRKKVLTDRQVIVDFVSRAMVVSHEFDMDIPGSGGINSVTIKFSVNHNMPIDDHKRLFMAVVNELGKDVRPVLTKRKQRVEFRLTMSKVNSWNGKWSGEDRDYLLWRDISPTEQQRIGMKSGKGRWTYSWEDGWGAAIDARVMEPGECKWKSAGFCGYEWMVENILRWGTTVCQCEWRGMEVPPRGESGQWEECIHCRTLRKGENPCPESS